MSSQIFLHPLVIMNIADHQARSVAESGKYDPKNPPRVLGAVFGIQVGQRVEIMSSVELPYSFDEEKQIRINDDATIHFTEEKSRKHKITIRKCTLRLTKKTTPCEQNKIIYQTHKETIHWLDCPHQQHHFSQSVHISLYS